MPHAWSSVKWRTQATATMHTPGPQNLHTKHTQIAYYILWTRHFQNKMSLQKLKKADRVPPPAQSWQCSSVANNQTVTWMARSEQAHFLGLLWTHGWLGVKNIFPSFLCTHDITTALPSVWIVSLTLWAETHSNSSVLKMKLQCCFLYWMMWFHMGSVNILWWQQYPPEHRPLSTQHQMSKVLQTNKTSPPVPEKTPEKH